MVTRRGARDLGVGESRLVAVEDEDGRRARLQHVGGRAASVSEADNGGARNVLPKGLWMSCRAGLEMVRNCSGTRKQEKAKGKGRLCDTGGLVECCRRIYGGVCGEYASDVMADCRCTVVVSGVRGRAWASERPRACGRECGLAAWPACFGY